MIYGPYDFISSQSTRFIDQRVTIKLEMESPMIIAIGITLFSGNYPLHMDNINMLEHIPEVGGDIIKLPCNGNNFDSSLTYTKYFGW